MFESGKCNFSIPESENLSILDQYFKIWLEWDFLDSEIGMYLCRSIFLFLQCKQRETPRKSLRNFTHISYNIRYSNMRCINGLQHTVKWHSCVHSIIARFEDNEYYRVSTI